VRAVPVSVRFPPKSQSSKLRHYPLPNGFRPELISNRHAGCNLGEGETSVIEVTKFEFSKNDFAMIPKEERALIFLAGHTVNAINTWLKIIKLSSLHEPVRTVEAKLSAAQTQILLRALFGTIHEAWVWQTRVDMGPLIGRKYLPNLPPAAKEARTFLTKHLGGSGLLSTLRNSYAYHSPSADRLDVAFEAMPPEEDWSWYVTDQYSSSFFLSCETVIGYGIAGVAEAPDLNAGLTQILSETIMVANAMNLYVEALLVAAVKSNIPAKPPQSIAMRVDDAVDARTFSLPFYVEGL